MIYRIIEATRNGPLQRGRTANAPTSGKPGWKQSPTTPQVSSERQPRKWRAVKRAWLLVIGASSVTRVAVAGSNWIAL
jgi:hypothetical protein